MTGSCYSLWPSMIPASHHLQEKNAYQYFAQQLSSIQRYSTSPSESRRWSASILLPFRPAIIDHKLNWLGQPFAIIAIGLAKVSVALLLLRLIGPKPRWPRHFLYFTMISSMIISIIAIIVTFVQCSPSKALWEPTISHHCWNPHIQLRLAIFNASRFTFQVYIVIFWILLTNDFRLVCLYRCCAFCFACILISALQDVGAEKGRHLPPIGMWYHVRSNI